MNKIKFAKNRQWYIPFDADSYRRLVEIGITSTQIHEDMIPIIKLAAEKKNYVLTGTNYRPLEDEFIDKIIRAWSRHEGRSARAKKNQLILRANAKAFSRAKSKGIPRAEQALRRFFERWGLDAEFTYSEKEGERLRLVVQWVKRDTKPIIDVLPQIEDQYTYLELGLHRIRASHTKKYLYLDFQSKQGSGWANVRTWRVKSDDVADTSRFIGMLIASQSE